MILKYFRTMKTKLAIMLTGMVTIIAGCQLPGYLPNSESLGTNAYGSRIILKCNHSPNIQGELIAADSSQLFILKEQDKGPRLLTMVQLTDIKHFRLQYARPVSSSAYGWAVPLFGALTASHGLWFIISLPINLLVTISVSASAIKTFEYNDRTLPVRQLNMFARFPQGIPPGFGVVGIR